ncbi:rhodanese-like domain-containing protein [Sungkyunkwania multivorans]|uniref:Rhodanese-like domain-containing protein n=1 Tax=Sungkyunkwania multivorans TaxID=1173618 RepID=A0ABW3D1Z5_9FLAO
MGLFSKKNTSSEQRSGASDKLIIDVRTPSEYIEGHVTGSINIPVHELRTKVKELDIEGKSIILYSGNGKRSEHASFILKSLGVDSKNAGGLNDLTSKLRSSNF